MDRWENDRNIEKDKMSGGYFLFITYWRQIRMGKQKYIKMPSEKTIRVWSLSVF